MSFQLKRTGFLLDMFDFYRILSSFLPDTGFLPDFYRIYNRFLLSVHLQYSVLPFEPLHRLSGQLEGRSAFRASAPPVGLAGRSFHHSSLCTARRASWKVVLPFEPLRCPSGWLEGRSAL